VGPAADEHAGRLWHGELPMWWFKVWVTLATAPLFQTPALNEYSQACEILHCLERHYRNLVIRFNKAPHREGILRKGHSLLGAGIHRSAVDGSSKAVCCWTQVAPNRYIFTKNNHNNKFIINERDISSNSKFVNAVGDDIDNTDFSTSGTGTGSSLPNVTNMSMCVSLDLSHQGRKRYVASGASELASGTGLQIAGGGGAA
jgi:hypothetical protein